MIKIQNVVVLCALLFSSSYAYGETDPYSRTELLKSVNRMAKQLPMQIDTVTRISSVALLNNRKIQYRYSLNKDKVIQIAAAQAKMSVGEFSYVAKKKYGSMEKLLSVWSKNILSKRIVSSNCSTPATKAWLSHGVTLVHAIYDDHGVFMHEEIVTNKRCK